MELRPKFTLRPGRSAPLLRQGGRQRRGCHRLDLEDAIPPHAKLQARAGLQAARQAVQARRCVIRVDADPDLLAGDIRPAAAAGADEVCSRRSNRPPTWKRLAEPSPAAWWMETSTEHSGGDDGRRPSVAGSCRDGGPIVSVALGMETLAAVLQLAARDAPTRMTPLAPSSVLLHTVASSVVPLGLIGELGNFTNLELFRQATVTAWRSGYRGYCIHPAQVAIANEAYAPGAEDVRWAEK